MRRCETGGKRCSVLLCQRWFSNPGQPVGKVGVDIKGAAIYVTSAVLASNRHLETASLFRAVMICRLLFACTWDPLSPLIRLVYLRSRPLPSHTLVQNQTPHNNSEDSARFKTLNKSISSRKVTHAGIYVQLLTRSHWPHSLSPRAGDMRIARGRRSCLAECETFAMFATGSGIESL